MSCKSLMIFVLVATVQQYEIQNPDFNWCSDMKTFNDDTFY